MHVCRYGPKPKTLCSDPPPACAQPNILDEYVKERGAASGPAPAKLTAPEDVVILEDEKARMVLRGDQLPIDSLVTGAHQGVCAQP